MQQRMDLWDRGQYKALVDDTETEALERATSGVVRDEESLARSFNAKVLSGRLRLAVRHLTSREGGGVLQPDDACTKTGPPLGGLPSRDGRTTGCPR